MSTSGSDKLGMYMTASFAALLGVDRDELPNQRRADKGDKKTQKIGRAANEDRRVDSD
ncbi:MAG: hypothetical protein O7C63_05300 [Alphaproteobacteria bacterium]|nr:hypothetical protein [Alphaproteobacteria bacterium]MCZ6764335.1 hypothetical protein [Alphaproteobacteria bacterium]